jgi:hypothetical protein
MDWNKRTLCPTYDVDNCLTPENPPACPLLDQKIRHPCYRYRCSDSATVEKGLSTNVKGIHTVTATGLLMNTCYWVINEHLSFRENIGFKFDSTECFID